MSGKKLVIGTTQEASIFEPIKIEIVGVEYNVFVTYTDLKKMIGMESSVRENGLEAFEVMYEQAAMITGAPRDVLDKLDVREIREILIYTLNEVLARKKKTAETDAEKNG